MLEDLAVRRRWSVAARARAAEFPEEVTVATMVALYQEVLSRKAIEEGFPNEEAVARI